MTEQQIQKKITDNLESEGWVVVKLMKTSTNGIPDLMGLREGIAKFQNCKNTESNNFENKDLKPLSWIHQPT